MEKKVATIGVFARVRQADEYDTMGRSDADRPGGSGAEGDMVRFGQYGELDEMWGKIGSRIFGIFLATVLLGSILAVHGLSLVEPMSSSVGQYPTDPFYQDAGYSQIHYSVWNGGSFSGMRTLSGVSLNECSAAFNFCDLYTETGGTLYSVRNGGRSLYGMCNPLRFL